MSKACLLLLVFLLLLSSPGLAQIADPDTSTQLTELEAQAQKLITDYADQKKQVDVELQSKLSTLGQTADDRLKRKKLMVETKNTLDELQSNFKVNMDSIREAQNSLSGTPRVIGLPQPEVKKRTETKNFMAPREGEVSIAERIRSQDSGEPKPRESEPAKTTESDNNSSKESELTTEGKDVKEKDSSKGGETKKDSKKNTKKKKNLADAIPSTDNQSKKHKYKTRLEKQPRKNY